METDLAPGRRAVEGFRPSVHGFRFANRFPPGPTIVIGPFDIRRLGLGDASAGLCGGMTLTVRDLFDAGIPVPGDPEPPVNGSRRFRALVRRQVQSLDWLRVPIRFWRLQALHPDRPAGPLAEVARWLGLRPAAEVTLDREWPGIRATLDSGRLAVVGLVRAEGLSPWRLAVSHQVLAWAWQELPDGARMWIYDPNHPGRDDVTIELRRTGSGVSVHQSSGEPLRGALGLPYAPAPVGAWRPVRSSPIAGAAM
jgi:hypothetical protein